MRGWRNSRRKQIGIHPAAGAAAAGMLTAVEAVRASLAFDLRATDVGGAILLDDKNAAVEAPGDTITFGVFARLTGTNGINDEKLNSLYGLINSVGAIKGNLLGGVVHSFTDSGFSNGAHVDWDSDGDLDIGASPSSSSATGKLFARNGTAGGYELLTPIDENSSEIKIGEFVFTVTDVGAQMSTDITFWRRSNNGNNVAAGGLWFEDGSTVSKNPTNSPMTVDPPIHVIGPSSGIWNNAAGGSYQTNGNWFGSLPPDTNDIANFFTGGNTYTVTFSSNASVAGIAIAGDNVTLDLNGNAFATTGASGKPILVADGTDGSLTVIDGSFSTSAGAGNARAIVAQGASALGSVTVSTGGLWSGDTNLTIGNAGDGTLAVEEGGDVALTGAGMQYFGELAGSSGALTVRGAGSTVSFANSSALVIGAGGSGAMNVTSGGAVNSARPIVLADSAGSSASVSVRGASSSLSTTQGRSASPAPPPTTPARASA